MRIYPEVNVNEIIHTDPEEPNKPIGVTLEFETHVRLQMPDEWKLRLVRAKYKIEDGSPSTAWFVLQANRFHQEVYIVSKLGGVHFNDENLTEDGKKIVQPALTQETEEERMKTLLNG